MGPTTRSPRRLPSILILPAVLLIPLAAAASPAPTIYGDDDRRDLHHYKPGSFLYDAAVATVALFDSEDVLDTPEGTLLRVRPHLKMRPPDPPPAKDPTRNQVKPEPDMLDLCPQEAFLGQPKGAFCSGFLAASGVVMTAGHCVLSQAECQKGVKAVFGFSLAEAGRTLDIVERGTETFVRAPADQVYGCKNLITRANDDKSVYKPDYAAFYLDLRGRKKDLPYLAVDWTGAIVSGTPLAMIGHPVGLPTKITEGARVLQAPPGENYFTADLDSFGGNSGSPVIDMNSRKVIGILVATEAPNFVREERPGEAPCLRSAKFPQKHSRNKVVQRISVVPKNSDIPRLKDIPSARGIAEPFKDW